VFGLVANVVLATVRTTPGEEKTDVNRIAPEFETAVPVWQLWQFGSWNQPIRVAAPTALIGPWQFWHWMFIVPSTATALPITPRRHLVVEPGCHL
jgi:hypothetical protein